jgi:hypothetical protein
MKYLILSLVSIGIIVILSSHFYFKGHVGLKKNTECKKDLAIGLHKKIGRPNVFIAWRNSERILEVEVEVKNYGDEQAEGYLSLAILDEFGKVLDYSPKTIDQSIKVTLPPYSKGGGEGKIIQTHGNKELNLLIDELDRVHARYFLKTEIKTIGNDKDYANNTSVKSFNVNSRLLPKAKHFYDYYFKNTQNMPQTVAWTVDKSNVKEGWIVDTYPSDKQVVTLQPNEIIQGYAIVTTPAALVEGDNIDIRIAAKSIERGIYIGQSECYLVYDKTPPEISDYGYMIDSTNGMITVFLTANDVTSMLKEASGMKVDYTVDGVTYSSKVLAYKDGNFVGPTRFGADIGGFSKGTDVHMVLVAEDIAGNISKKSLPTVKIIYKKDIKTRLSKKTYTAIKKQ